MVLAPATVASDVASASQSSFDSCSARAVDATTPLKIAPSCLRRCSNACFVRRWKRARAAGASASLRWCRTNFTTVEPISGRGQKQLAATFRTAFTS